MGSKYHNFFCLHLNNGMISLLFSSLRFNRTALKKYRILCDTFRADELQRMSSCLPCTGTVEIDLHSYPHGTKSAKSCKADMLSDGTERISIFQQKRSKGWWPFTKAGELTVGGDTASAAGTHSHQFLTDMAGSTRAKWRPSSTWFQQRRQRSTPSDERARNQSRC